MGHTEEEKIEEEKTISNHTKQLKNVDQIKWIRKAILQIEEILEKA